MPFFKPKQLPSTSYGYQPPPGATAVGSALPTNVESGVTPLAERSTAGNVAAQPTRSSMSHGHIRLKASSFNT
jgi:hypothetical protein